MAKRHKLAAAAIVGRLGKPTNLRAGGVVDSTNRRRDNRRSRQAVRMAMRSQSWDD